LGRRNRTRKRDPVDRVLTRPTRPQDQLRRQFDRWDDATGSNLYEHLAGVERLPVRAGLLRGRCQPLARREDHPAQRESTASRVISSFSGHGLDEPERRRIADALVRKGCPGVDLSMLPDH
jgi:hypothetical protein